MAMESSSLFCMQDQSSAPLTMDRAIHESVTTQSPSRSTSAAKVRKPYVTTKRRQRWTDEEHRLFVEALKLYGRAWRQVEEHVGTKTAIQIRSHAQKFFAKVSHDSGALKPEYIPPPRPKKKPLHPYPRKTSFDSFEKERYSPTSDLSSAAEMNPSSCATDESSGNLLNLYDYESENSFHHSAKKLELSPQVTETAIKRHTSIKLFGETVVVKDQSSEVIADKNDGSNNIISHSYFSKPPYVFSWYFFRLHPYSSSCMTPLVSPHRSRAADSRIGTGSESRKEPEKGFVPYKRCLSERDEMASLNLVEEREWEGQRARACS